MVSSTQEVQDYIVAKLNELAEDWDNSFAITAETSLFRELGMESLEVVILATAIQEHFQKQMPFAEFFAEIGARGQGDLTVSELASFVSDHVGAAAESMGEGR